MIERPILRLAFAGTACLAVAACSWTTDFVVVNRSDQPIAVTYGYADSALFSPPRMLEVEGRLPKSMWVDGMTQAEFERDGESNLVTVTLPPSTAVVVHTAVTYQGPRDYEPFRLAHLMVSGAGGRLEAHGPPIERLFQKRSDRLWFLEFGTAPPN